MEIINLFCISLFIAILTIAILKRSLKIAVKKNLPPSPWKLPIIGHMHHLADGLPAQRSFRKLSQKYGDIIYLELGKISTILVSSPRLAKEIMRSQDLVFASRPDTMLGRVIFYDGMDVLCSPYGEYWRLVRKICTTELLTARRVQSFGWIRQEEALDLIRSIKDHALSKTPVNLSRKVSQYNGSVVMKATLGTVGEEDRDAFIPLITKAFTIATNVDVSDIFPSMKFLHYFLSSTAKLKKIHGEINRILENVIDQHLARRDKDDGCDGDLLNVLLRLQDQSGEAFTNTSIKAILLDMFAGGTETASSTIEWAMTEMIRNPDVMAKAQNEARNTFGRNRTSIKESEIQELKYLNLVVKETLRLYPPGPMLFPRESIEECEIDGYNIPAKTRALINIWAIARNSEYWDDPEIFKPERFDNSGLDFTGNHFQYLPFGAGRRMCPGMNFGLANVKLILALLLYHFNWELPDGLKPDQLDMAETIGTSLTRTNNLVLLPKLSG